MPDSNERGLNIIVNMEKQLKKEVAIAGAIVAFSCTLLFFIPFLQWRLVYEVWGENTIFVVVIAFISNTLIGFAYGNSLANGIAKGKEVSHGIHIGCSCGFFVGIVTGTAIFPIIGTVIGAVIGGIVGTIAGVMVTVVFKKKFAKMKNAKP